MTNEIASFAGFDQGFDITKIGQAAATVNPTALIEPEPAVTGKSMSGIARPTTGAFGLYLVHIGPMLWRPRADGEPG